MGGMDDGTAGSGANAGCRVFDLHCDTLDALCMGDAGPFADQASRLAPGDDLAHNGLQLATDRMRAVGPWCQCLAVWVPDDLGGTGLSPHGFYERVSSYLRSQLAAHPDELAQVRDARRLGEALEGGRVAAILTVENASPLEDGIGVLDQMAADGVRMVTLTWNGPNCVGSGNDTDDGLSHFGVQAVRRMEELRIVVDVSHLNDVGFRDVLRASRRPFVASHSNSRAVCDQPRNLTDYEFEAIADRGGLVGINYYRSFVSPRFPNASDVPGPARPDVTFDELSRHIDHFLGLGGEEVIALGSDFDGSETPSWLAGAEDLPAFRARVAARFGEDVAERMFFGNARSFFERNETA